MGKEKILVKELARQVGEKAEYKSKAITQSIRATSGITFEIKGKWYKLAYEEERILPKVCDRDAEIKLLFDHCNKIVDDQVGEILELYEK